MTKFEMKLSNSSDLKKITKRHWSFSKWFTLSELLQWASGHLVIIFTGSILGASSVGIMKAAQNIMAISHILFQAMENFVPARASNIFSKSGILALRAYKNKIVMVGGVATASLACVVFIFAEKILDVVYGQEFSVHAYVLQWFSLIYIFMFLGFPLRAALRAIENTKAIFFSKVLAAFVVVAFCYPAIQKFGLTGSLVSLLMVNVVAFVFLQFYFSKSMNSVRAEAV